MKKILLLFFVCSFVGLGFSGCGDDDDETFVTNEAQVKEMIKAKWTVRSIKLQSNYSELDQSMNKSFTQSLKSSSTTLTFDGEYVWTGITKNNSNLEEAFKEKYYFQSNRLYVEDIALRMTVGNNCQVSEHTLVITGDFTREIFVKTLEVEAAMLGTDYSEIIAGIPQNFSGKLIYILKR